MATSNDDFLRRVPGILNQLLSTCLERGMVLPFISVVASANGSIFAVRYVQAADGLEPVRLTQHLEAPGFTLPINIMIMDQTGEAARIKLETTGAVSYH
jgi:hypothetical protein